MARRDRQRAGPSVAGDPHALENERLRATIEDLRTENQQLLESQPALEISRDEYVDLFDSAPLPSLVLDRRGIIRAVNRAAAALFVSLHRKVIGRRLSQLIHADDRPLVLAHLDRCARLDTSDQCEVRLEIAGVAACYVQLSSRRSLLGRQIFQTTVVDTNARAHEKIEKEALREAVESANRASEAKDKFIAMLSHELRTPLTPVLMGASALLADAALPARARAVLATIVRNARLESRLVDDLLDVTRIVQGKMHLQRAPTDLHEIVRTVCETLALGAREKGHEVSVELKADHPIVEADPVRMHQLVSNLIRNAIKFTPAGGKIRVRSWTGRSAVVLEVEDNGIGMDSKQVSSIFAPFNQLEPESPRTAGGLGLGLTICKAIADLHGAKLVAVSRGRGRGSRFVLQMEAARDQSARLLSRARAPSVVRPSAVALPRTGCRVLLVEDHADTAELVSDLLVAEGFEVDWARSISDALSIDLAKVDVIVSDLGLPDGNGLDLIRTLQETRHHPAIALSGFGMGSDVEASLQAGFDAHLTKPVDIGELLYTIRTVTARAHGPRQLTGHTIG